MGKYWDWYEVEFERVARKLLPERKTEILESLREHVSESTGEFLNESRGSDEAERLAVKNLGSPRLVVQAELDRPRRDWLPVLFAVVGLGWMGFFVCLSTEPWSMAVILPAMVATPCLVFLSSLGKKRPKFWALGGTTAVLGLAMILVFCFGWIDMNRAGGLGFMPKWHIASLTENNTRLVANYKEDREFIADVWGKVNRQETAEVKKLTVSEHGWKVPGEGVYPGMGHTWVYIDKFEEAKRGWSKPLETLTGPVDRSIQRVTANLQAMRDARSFSPQSIWSKNGAGMGGVILLAYLAVAASHGLGLLLSAIPTWLVRRRWRVAI